jgi:hypothetical protein
MRRRTLIATAIVGLAGVAMAAPPPRWIVSIYADRVYPAIQPGLSGLSNLTRLPLFDLLLVAGFAAVGWGAVWCVRQARRQRSLRPLGRFGLRTATSLAIVYLWFLAAWGLNYRRRPVESILPDVDPARVTPAAVRALAERAVAAANRLHASAHAQGFPALDEAPTALLASLHEVERQLGRPRPTLATFPKRPLSAPYMRAVGVSGMVAPLFLETYLNPDLTGPERPYVLAHEWAHLSGFASEDEASFVGMVAALGADVAAQYSAWLSLVFDAASQLQPVTRDLVLAQLAEGPREDQRAIARRLQRRVPVLDRASWVAYDRAIKSQGATDGVAGYGRVVQLLLSTGVIERGGALR